MKFVTILSFAVSALAVAVDVNKRDSPLSVKLEQSSDAGMKATVTNTGSSDVKVMKAGSLLDTSLIEKTQVFQNGELPPTHGSSMCLITLMKSC